MGTVNRHGLKEGGPYHSVPPPETESFSSTMHPSLVQAQNLCGAIVSKEKQKRNNNQGTNLQVVLARTWLKDTLRTVGRVACLDLELNAHRDHADA